MTNKPQQILQPTERFVKNDVDTNKIMDSSFKASEKRRLNDLDHRNVAQRPITDDKELFRLKNVRKTPIAEGYLLTFTESQYKIPSQRNFLHSLVNLLISKIYQKRRASLLELTPTMKKRIASKLNYTLATTRDEIHIIPLLTVILKNEPTLNKTVTAYLKPQRKRSIIKRKTKLRVCNNAPNSLLQKKIFIKRTKSKVSLIELKHALKARFHDDLRYGRIFIRLKNNNAFANLSNKRNQIIFRCSSGMLGYQGKKKKTFYAKRAIGRRLAKRILRKKYRVLDIFLKAGLGRFYKAVILSLVSQTSFIRLIRVLQTHPHGYVRKRKARRV